MDEQLPPDQPIPPETLEEEPPQPVREYLKTVEPLQKHKKSRLIKFVIIMAVILVIAGVGGFLFLKNKQAKTVQQQQPVPEAAVAPKVSISSNMTKYSSTQFSLDFEYPSDWEVKDDQTGGTLKVTSPNLSIPANGGGVTTGKVVLTIRGKNQKLPEFDKGNATAVIDSEKVAYSKPSSAQRGQTYLSFLSYATSANTLSIDGIYITGDFGYQKDQAIPKVDIQKIDPIINLTFFACDGSCTKPIGIAPEAWTSPEFGGALKKILQSLTIN